MALQPRQPRPVGDTTQAPGSRHQFQEYCLNRYIPQSRRCWKMEREVGGPGARPRVPQMSFPHPSTSLHPGEPRSYCYFSGGERLPENSKMKMRHKIFNYRKSGILIRLKRDHLVNTSDIHIYSSYQLTYCNRQERFLNIFSKSRQTGLFV